MMDDIKQKELLLEEILNNTKAQTFKIEEGDMEALDILINKRELLMNQVDTLDRAMPNDISQVEMESIQDLLTKIIELDNSNQSLIQKEYSHIKSELRKIRIGRKREETYGDEYGLYKEEGLFFDKGK